MKKILLLMILFSLSFSNEIEFLGMGDSVKGILGVRYYCLNGIVYVAIDHTSNTTFVPVYKISSNFIFKTCNEYFLEEKNKKSKEKGE
ncbi:hypothetical protein [Helicobacter japonicus]|uniref:hypothetical protein n=1 Tax=Helicobacter japonicus TaxID=425400 RepID=UPI0023F23708|nr:hypothetical protein [Helicobacter japonicus]